MTTSDLPCIVCSDEQYLIFYKPALMHSVLGKEGGSLAEWIQTTAPEVVNFGRRPEDCGLLNRLDFETSGLLIAAKSTKARELFLQESDTHSVRKQYLFISDKQPQKNIFPNGAALCTSFISQKYPSSKKVIVSDKPMHTRSQEASTALRWIATANGASVYQAEIALGKRHQIRAHAAAMQIPLSNDVLYGGSAGSELASSFLLHNYSVVCDPLKLSATYLPSVTSLFGKTLEDLGLRQSVEDFIAQS